jgi:hypothetical protein
MINANESMPPDLKVVLKDLKNEIFSTFNCIQIGIIEKVTPANQTVEITLQIKRAAVDGTSTAIPLLVDCPYFVLQGGGAYIDMPISKGDYCVVLFNDRDIDTWWSTANMTDPNTTRKHSLSDGIALVGINPKPNALPMDGTKTRVINPDGIELNGNTKTFVTHTELNTALQTFITALNLHTHVCAAVGVPSATPLPAMSIDISAAKTTTVKTGG